MSRSVWSIDTLVKEKKNRSRISFSWGFEYRFLQELSDDLIQRISKYHKIDPNRLLLIRHPSVPAYKDLTKYLSISRIIRLTPEVICVEGDCKSRYMLHLKGMLAYLMPGQSYLDAMENLESGTRISDLEVESVWQQRLSNHFRLKKSLSGIYGISVDQVAFSWGSGAALELVLWSIKNKNPNRPKMLINVPNYFYTCALAQKFDYEIDPVGSHSKGKYEFPIRKILNALRNDEYDIVVLTSPNNPYGVPISRQSFEEILDSLPPRTLALIDFTGLTARSEFHIKDILQHPEWTTKRIIMIDSLSKKFEMCHARTGFIIGSNPDLLRKLSLEEYSPVLTSYAYSKMEEAIDHPRLNDKVLRKHRRYFSLLKSVENQQFKLVSPQFSNFIVSRFRTPREVTRFIDFLANKFKYYDLPFKGIGVKNSGQGSISQNFIQYMPRNELRLLEETAPFIRKCIREFSKSRMVPQKKKPL